jgi:activator of HSP90 ATPase
MKGDYKISSGGFSTKKIELKTKTLRQKATIPADPMKVYEAYMDAEKHAEFTGSKATFDPRVGGEFTAWDGYIAGKNLELEPGKRIVQEWRSSDFPEGYAASRLELNLKDIKGSTELTMVHSGVPVEIADDIAQGWKDFYWEPMKKYFEKN